jgi:phosphoglycolate phosphatase-like HAD superfamily hydrolase
MKPKLLLFDIDGTLLSAHDVPRKAMSTVLAGRFNNFRYDRDYDFSGRTDPQIIEHLLRHDGRECTETIVEEILHEFCLELEKEIYNGQPPVLHPGVSELIQNFNELDDVFLGLVTGNVSEGARIKLEAAGLNIYFSIGGFGDDSKDRNELPPIATKRAETHFQTSFEPENIWIIGDSIYDVECAQKNNLRCLAVGTGKTSSDKLKSANPEFFVNDLGDVAMIKDILTNC